MIQIGIDTGGTFTDIVIYEKGRIITRKVPSNREKPHLTLLQGLSGILDANFELTYGTTIATNAFLEKKGDRTAFLSTKGFEHILHLQRQTRTNLFSLFPEKADSIVDRQDCCGINERILYTGEIIKDIDLRELQEILNKLKEKEIKCVSIVFLHSYKNTFNEKTVEKYFKERGFFVSSSYQILPEQREYERAVATTLNVYLMPTVHKHIEDLKTIIKKPFYIMQSVGGFLSPSSAQQYPIKTILSGPVGGVIAARHYCQGHKLITLDMGGTSTDISLIDKDIIISQESELENLPIRIPTVFIKTVGAGGGSIAWFDKAGVLKLGPHSAGADPGPACYGRSNLCTLTDAYIVLGYIRPDLFLGGRMKIYSNKSRKAVSNIAKRLNKSIEETAEGIIDLSIILMEKALRNVILEKGYNPGRFSLMPFGGAGGLAAVELAEKLGMSKIIIPPYQGVFSAVGMLLAKSTREASMSILKPLSNIDLIKLEKLFSKIEGDIEEEISRDFGIKPKIAYHRTIDLRYKGQSFYLNIPCKMSKEEIMKDFNRIHKRIYSHSFDNKEIEIVNIRVKGISRDKELLLPSEEEIEYSKDYPRSEKIYFDHRYQDALFYIKESIKENEHISGPAILSSSHSTAFIPPNYTGKKTKKGNLIIERNEI